MPRYIDADKVLETMRSNIDMQELYLPTHFIDLVIEDVPTADVQPVKHGRWVENSDPGQNINEHYMCSECGCTFHNWANDNYCPNCGAKMGGGSE